MLRARCKKCNKSPQYLNGKGSSWCATCLVDHGYVYYDRYHNAQVVKPFPKEVKE